MSYTKERQRTMNKKETKGVVKEIVYRWGGHTSEGGIYWNSWDCEDPEEEMAKEITDFVFGELAKAKTEAKIEVLEEIQRMMEDEMLVINRDGVGVVEGYITEWLSNLSEQKK